MARPKKNTDKIKKEAGSLRKKIKNNISINTVSNDIFSPPDYLNNYAKQKWNELANELYAKKIISNVDKTALEILSLNYGIARESYDAMIRESTDGTIAGYINGRNSQMMGEYNAYDKSMKVVQRLLLEFGLTPASRSRVPEQEVQKEVDPITEMLNN